MAYAALVSLSQILEQILQHDQYFYIPLHEDEDHKLKSLQEKVCLLQGFLDDHQPHIGGERNHIQYQSLESQIRDAAYKAQDIIEFHISDHNNTCKFGGNSSCGLWQLFPSHRKERAQTVLNEYESELVKSLNQIDLVIDETKNIQRSSRGKMQRIGSAPSLASSSNSKTNDGNKMVGFDEDLLKIKEVLCDGRSSRKVVSIVGMGGIGKTTLARHVFADPYIAHHFHTRAWATISQGYSLRGILLSVLHTLTLKTEKVEEFIPKSYLAETSDEELKAFVYKSLKLTTYLVVMDDMWSTDAWDNVGRIFPDDGNGSRVVITTRQRNVAEHASSSHIHRLHFLNADQSWSLIQDKVFVGQSCPVALERIGRKIAENCGGLPLAIVVVAGILAKVERSKHQWQNCAEKSLAMTTSDEHFSNILSLSYDYLPNHLKPCFLYMGSFLDVAEVRISKLIMLWVAEGFLKPMEGSKTSEEVAEDYLEDLVKRNLVLVTETRSNGKYKSCTVHDLLRDLCVRKAREEKFLHVRPSSGADIADLHQRRIVLDANHYRNAATSSLRSVLYFGTDSNILDFVVTLRLLRVLHIPNVQLHIVVDLFHLRYLAFTYGGHEHLKLHKLHNLQTLIIHPLSYSTPLGALEIWKIPKLKHLVLFDARLRIALPPRLVSLSNIQTLTGVVDFSLSTEAIGMIPHLKRLKASYTRMSESKCRELRLANLDRLEKLETLDLAFVSAPSTVMMRIRGRPSVPFPSMYTLPPNLKKLALTGCSPPSEDMSVIGSLPNLEVLKLREFFFPEQEWDAKEEEFGKLKFLMMELSNLVCWEAESRHFPCLEQLVIKKCRSLEKIPSAIGDIATLHLMEVGPYSKSAVESAMLIRDEQESNGNEGLQVRVYLEEWEHVEQDFGLTSGEESYERSLIDE